MSAAVRGSAGETATPVEGFAIATRDGLVFTVKGHVHPPGRTVAYLRYFADPDGDRVCAGRRYRKVRTFAEQAEALAPWRETYLWRDPCAGTVLQSVPGEAVARVFDPRDRLAAIAACGPADALEEAALRLAGLLATAAGVAPRALGVTGSLLVGLHASSSDLDLVVYGGAACRAAYEALGRLLDEGADGLRRPDDGDLARIHAAHRLETPLEAVDFRRLQRVKVNEGRFGERPFFVRFVRLPAEVGERYGDVRYTPLERVTVEGRVCDVSEAIFTPCRYAVEHVKVVSGTAPAPAARAAATGSGAAAGAAAEPVVAGAVAASAAAPAADLREIVSFRGRFADQARAGETVRARGTLEEVRARGTLEDAAPRSGAAYCRLVVGAAGDYLVSLPA